MEHNQQLPKYWFGSDFHFGQTNILDYCNRPFMDMRHQDQELVRIWNYYVRPGDVAFILGDFSFYSPSITTKILTSMNGQKTLIKGNHDHTKDLKHIQGWSRVLSYLELRLGLDRVVLSHFPIMSWHQMHRGSYHLHGHSHGSLQYPGELGLTRIMDVGLDHIVKLTSEYRPLEWVEIKGLLSKRMECYSGDHHKVRP